MWGVLGIDLFHHEDTKSRRFLCLGLIKCSTLILPYCFAEENARLGVLIVNFGRVGMFFAYKDVGKVREQGAEALRTRGVNW